MEFKTSTSPFYNSNDSINSVMLQVLYALVPGTLVMFYFFGWGILFNLVLSILFAISLEALALKIRNRPIKPFLYDLSAVVTAWLLALTLPPLMPWWVVFVGIFFAIIVAKHIYGGIGYNPFNPAMVGYAVLIISFPLEMSQWLTPGYFSNYPETTIGFTESLKMLFASGQSVQWDAITSATPLDEVKTGLRANIGYQQIISESSYLGSLAQNSWFWSSLAYAIGGIWLLYKKVIQWQIPVSMIGVLLLLSAGFYLYSPENFASPWHHLISGATILGAFFIATDPVSSSTTPIGKLVFGASIGFFLFIIRQWGNYPDAVAFSVLIMNMAVPMIDYYTQPRVLGHDSAFASSKSATKSGDDQ